MGAAIRNLGGWLFIVAISVADKKRGGKKKKKTVLKIFNFESYENKGRELDI